MGAGPPRRRARFEVTCGGDGIAGHAGAAPLRGTGSATAPCWRFHARRSTGATAGTMRSRPLSAATKTVVKLQIGLDVKAMNIAPDRIEIIVAASKSAEIRVVCHLLS